jgi:hypothetical protein
MTRAAIDREPGALLVAADSRLLALLGMTKLWGIVVSGKTCC